MGKGQKVVTTVLWALLVCAMLGVVGFGMWIREEAANRGDRSDVVTDVRVSVVSPAGEEEASGGLPVLYDAPPFSLINQNAAPVSNEDLRGNVWVAAFIFTHCAGPCPMMSAKMAQLQRSVSDPSVKLVSFTVDPERDTPAVLKEYAAKFDADESRWHFLTGPKDAMFAVAEGMMLPARPGDAQNEIMHSSRLLLVDPQGRVRGVYSIDDAGEMKKLAADALELARAGAAASSAASLEVTTP